MATTPTRLGKSRQRGRRKPTGGNCVGARSGSLEQRLQGPVIPGTCSAGILVVPEPGYRAGSSLEPSWPCPRAHRIWQRGDRTLRPSGYEPDELPDCLHPAPEGARIIGRPGASCNLIVTFISRLLVAAGLDLSRMRAIPTLGPLRHDTMATVVALTRSPGIDPTMLEGIGPGLGPHFCPDPGHQRHRPEIARGHRQDHPAFLSWLARRGERGTACTSGFVHADLGHLIFNMITFFFFAFSLERTIGTARFIILYCGAGACSDLAPGGNTRTTWSTRRWARPVRFSRCCSRTSCTTRIAR